MVLIITKVLKNGLKMHLEVQNQKISTQGKGQPFPWTPSPAALALWASPHTKYSIDVAYSNLLFRALYGLITTKKLKVVWNATREV